MVLLKACPFFERSPAVAEPKGKKLVVGKDISAADLIKQISRKKMKKAAPKQGTRKLGPGVEIPPKYLEAQEILLKKLITGAESTSKGRKSASMGRENILGMHIGQKLVDGEPTGSLAVVVTVKKKVADAKKIQAKFRIPKRIKVGKEFVPVDVKIGFEFKPQAAAGEKCTLNKPPAGPGSIGCFCFVNLPNGGHADLLLTNNHVIGRFANGNAGSNVSVDNVFDLTGNVVAGDPIVCGTLDGDDGLSIDAALGFAGGRNPSADSKRHAGGLNYTGNIRTAQVGDTVKMFGAFTGGITRGVVRRVQAFQSVPYMSANGYPINREISIKGVFVIEPVGSALFSRGGDSGSVIVHESSGDPVGILIGGGSTPGSPSLAADLATIRDDLFFDGIHSVP
jgi:endonuclease G, mitochondrial